MLMDAGSLTLSRMLGNDSPAQRDALSEKTGERHLLRPIPAPLGRCIERSSGGALS